MNSLSDRIQLAHGGGGRLSLSLINDEIVPRFGKGPLDGLPDAATLGSISGDIVFSTDSYVVSPYKFSGGNIGNLAVHGTVNDIFVSGGSAKWLSIGLILEEGFSMSELQLILDSIKSSAGECEVKIVTGDTKVVNKGQCDGIYINSAGIGEKIKEFNLSKSRLAEGDAIIVSGNVGDHGMAILSAREGVNMENGPVSDTASVRSLVLSICQCASKVKFMRDPTRGGVAAVLNEIVSGTKLGAALDSRKIPVSNGAGALAEILGIDILNVACEGRMILICDRCVADNILSVWKSFPEGVNASIMGYINNEAQRVILKTVTGGSRLVDLPAGELLPRIC